MSDDFQAATNFLYVSEIEKKLLGACMTEEAILHKAIPYLKPGLFYDDLHKEIMQVILESLTEGKFADQLVVHNKLIQKKSLTYSSRGAYYLVEITNNAFYVQDSLLMEHLNILREYYFRRRVVEINHDYTQKQTGGEDSMESYTNQLHDLISLNAELTVDKNDSLPSIVNVVRGQVEDAFNGVMPSNILPTGLKTLDRILVGLFPTDLVLIGARPSMGKTALALTIVLNACMLDKAVKFYSLEMSRVQLIARLAAMISGVSYEFVKRGILNAEQRAKYNEALDKIEKFKLYVDDRAGLNPTMLRTSSIQDKSNGKQVDLIVVDYIQLMDVGVHASNRNVGVGIASTSLKVLAKDLNVPVIALSQLSRELERRVDKRPILADLRDSGSLEQDADMVLFLFRAEQYGVQAYDDNRSTVGVAEINVAKSRNGELGLAMVQFQKDITLFSDMNEAQLATFTMEDTGENPF